MERKLNPATQSGYIPFGWTPTANAEPTQPKRLPVDPITRKIATLEAAAEAERRQQAAEMHAALTGAPRDTPQANSVDAKPAVNVTETPAETADPKPPKKK
ncbi:hypothetical protein M2323_002752 [Rhodoblastus acidophilus]|uniref:hypothetical protein n=1 Tax=Rhodoblastus acidophilus TaxID=1074 RepID=UPI00222532CD|nr:hypothetical protein [Rhodoblastus acidophilus]MCW2284894.1 hypothetical protein [Rhodoblastus acidophilus]MCW2333816.1 hypothetical protein [Rhodoblastus acidophilus]